MSTPTAAAAALAAVFLLAGCGGEASAPAGDAAAAPSAESSAGPSDGRGDGSNDDRGAGTDREKGDDGTGDDETGSDAGDETASATVPEALDFSATQVSGEDFDASELAGTDTVFWFWAPWCTECAAAAPEVQAAADAAPDVHFVGVAGLSSDVTGMENFVDTHGLDFPQIADADGGVYTRFGITQQDTYVLVSADGDVETVDAYGGDIDVQQLVSESFG